MVGIKGQGHSLCLQSDAAFGKRGHITLQRCSDARRLSSLGIIVALLMVSFLRGATLCSVRVVHILIQLGMLRVRSFHTIDRSWSVGKVSGHGMCALSVAVGRAGASLAVNGSGEALCSNSFIKMVTKVIVHNWKCPSNHTSEPCVWQVRWLLA